MPFQQDTGKEGTILVTLHTELEDTGHSGMAFNTGVHRDPDPATFKSPGETDCQEDSRPPCWDFQVSGTVSQLTRAAAVNELALGSARGQLAWSLQTRRPGASH